jgi:internalin A
MKRYFPILLLVSGMAAAESPASPFRDSNLEAIVRKFLPDAKAGEPLSTARLESAVLVSGQGMPVSDLTGLEQCKNLRFLYLQNSPVTDLSPLAKLSQLEAITIQGGKIHDLTPLGGLPKLEYLDLSHNEIADLKPLMNLKSLKHFISPVTKSEISRHWLISRRCNICGWVAIS